MHDTKARSRAASHEPSPKDQLASMMQQLAKKQDVLQLKMIEILAASAKDQQLASTLQTQTTRISSLESLINSLVSQASTSNAGNASPRIAGAGNVSPSVPLQLTSISCIGSASKAPELGKQHWTEKVPALQQDLERLAIRIDEVVRSSGHHNPRLAKLDSKKSAFVVTADSSSNIQQPPIDSTTSAPMLTTKFDSASPEPSLAVEDLKSERTPHNRVVLWAAARVLQGEEGAEDMCLQHIRQANVNRVNQKDSNGRTALHYFALCGSVALTKAILQHTEFKEVNAADCLHESDSKSQIFNRTALHYAAIQGNKEIITLMLGRPDFVQIHLKDSSYFSALHLAAMGGHRDIVWLLKQYPPNAFVDPSIRRERLAGSPLFTPSSPFHARNFAGELAMIVEKSEPASRDVSPLDQKQAPEILAIEANAFPEAMPNSKFAASILDPEKAKRTQAVGAHFAPKLTPNLSFKFGHDASMANNKSKLSPRPGVGWWATGRTARSVGCILQDETDTRYHPAR